VVKIENKTVIKYRTVYKTLGVKEAARQTQLMPLQTWATSDGQLATDGSFYEIQASSSSWVYYSDLLIIVLILILGDNGSKSILLNNCSVHTCSQSL